MYPSYSVSFFFGFVQFQLQTLVADCPPSNSNAGAQTVQFCSDFVVNSSDIYIDSSDASTRVKNCTCTFKFFQATKVILKTLNNQTENCGTRILHGNNASQLNEYCGKINALLQTGLFSSTYKLVLINEQVNLKSYCLHLYTENNKGTIELKCFKDSPINTTETSSTEQSTSTKGTVAFISTMDVTTTGIPTAQTTVQSPSTTIKTSAYNNPNQVKPIHILAPAAGVGVLVVIGIIILAIVCSRRKAEYDCEPGPKTDSHTHINQSVVTDDGEDDETRVNDLYRSIDSEPQDDGFAGGYAETNSTDASHSRKSAASINKGEKGYSVPSNRPLTQVQGGDVYSIPVKKPKNRQEEINDTPVYAIPHKEKNIQNQETGPVYAVVDKKNKNGNSKTAKTKSNISKPAIKKKPPLIAPKPTGVNSGGDKKKKGNVNSDGLNYSEIEFNVSSNNSNRLTFNISEKTGYAEVL